MATKSRRARESFGTAKATSRNGARVIKWIEAHCFVPEGRDVGKPVRLRPWQKQEIKRIYDNPHGTRRAIVSWGRKNAKTTLGALLLLVHLCGPQSRVNSQLYSSAQSRDQAAILFALAAKVVRMSPDLREAVIIRDTAKQLACPERGTMYRALSAEASTAYGLSPVFLVHDELGQVRGPRSELYEALETATGAQDNPLSLIISTQAPNNGDLLSVLIDDALAGHDPRVICSLHTAPVEADPFIEATIKQANPAFGDFLNATEVLAMAEDARRMPSREAEYRNLVLNQRVEAQAPFISIGVWKGCGGDVDPLNDEDDIFGALDLSAVNDLTALMLIQERGSLWHAHPTFWLPQEGLHERARNDRVPYDLWEREKQLIATPGKSVEYEFVAEHLAALLISHPNIRKIAFDRWNFKNFRPWLVKAGIDEATINQVFVEMSQGFQAMSPALRELESVILNGKLKHGSHPVLNMCAQNAVVITDPNGNRKLAKNKSTGRIDGMVALAMAIGITAEQATEPEPSYQMFVLG